MTVGSVERIVACLWGVATGDAVGKQTETLAHERVLQWYPEGVRGFEGIPGTVIPRYAGNAKGSGALAKPRTIRSGRLPWRERSLRNGRCRI